MKEMNWRDKQARQEERGKRHGGGNREVRERKGEEMNK